MDQEQEQNQNTESTQEETGQEEVTEQQNTEEQQPDESAQPAQGGEETESSSEDSEHYRKRIEEDKKERDQLLEGVKNEREKNKKLKEEKKQIEESVEERVTEEISKLREEIHQDTFRDELDQVAKSDAEKEAIMHFYQNAIKQTGTSRDAIQRDLKNAKALANQGKTEAQLNETKEALNSERGKSRGAAASERQVNYSQGPELSPEDQKIVQRVAERNSITFDEAKKRVMQNA